MQQWRNLPLLALVAAFISWPEFAWSFDVFSKKEWRLKNRIYRSHLLQHWLVGSCGVWLASLPLAKSGMLLWTINMFSISFPTSSAVSVDVTVEEAAVAAVVGDHCPVCTAVVSGVGESHHLFCRCCRFVDWSDARAAAFAVWTDNREQAVS